MRTGSGPRRRLGKYFLVLCAQNVGIVQTFILLGTNRQGSAGQLSDRSGLRKREAAFVRSSRAAILRVGTLGEARVLKIWLRVIPHFAGSKGGVFPPGGLSLFAAVHVAAGTSTLASEVGSQPDFS